jgi:hypothetical protein
MDTKRGDIHYGDYILEQGVNKFMITHYRTQGNLVELLKETFYTTDFIKDHTRPELVVMLQTLYPKTDWKRGMCKRRQIKHIEHWLKLHNIDCRFSQTEYDYRTMTPFAFASKYYG